MLVFSSVTAILNRQITYTALDNNAKIDKSSEISEEIITIISLTSLTLLGPLIPEKKLARLLISPAAAVAASVAVRMALFSSSFSLSDCTDVP